MATILTNFAKKIVNLCLSFPAPSDLANRVDLSDEDAALILIQGLSEIHKQLKSGVGVGGSLPLLGTVCSVANVTDTPSVVHVAQPNGALVEIINSGTADVLLLPGVAPAFENEDTQPTQFGIPLAPGDMWESPGRITSSVMAVADPGQSCPLTIIRYF
jgi:hypothetical protein